MAAVDARGIVKRFAGQVALRGVDLRVAIGSCHGLLGENGAGKSTLGRVIAGVHKPDAGELAVMGKPARWTSPRDALRAGVAMVHQELAFCPELSVAENLHLGRWPTRGGFVQRRAMESAAREALVPVGLDIDPARAVGSLSTAQEQLLQIAQALASGARLVVFDEPTSSLDDAECQRLLALVQRLVREGLTVIWVSHRLPEVLAICDRMTVLRDGEMAGELEGSNATEERLVEMLVGEHRELRAAKAETAPPPRDLAAPAEQAPAFLRVEGLQGERGLGPIDLEVRAGEIVGLEGLLGSGRSRLLATLFGLLPRHAGRVFVGDTELPPNNVRAALNAGVALVPEDRKRQGLVLGLDAARNVALGQEARWQRGALLDLAAEQHDTHAALAELDVRGLRPGAAVAALSGGNQQKVVLARWLSQSPRVLLVDEPTRGVDVGAKAAIHARLHALAASGTAILLVSSDRPELRALSSRVIPMARNVT
ncbi:MAG: sugar ABC transporter ATP-binding protein [Planctomycetota bacterium]|nr:MAG: sugar ABC transporter ATP-binding protein [Planctomycetota bacterium]